MLHLSDPMIQFKFLESVALFFPASISLSVKSNSTHWPFCLVFAKWRVEIFCVFFLIKVFMC